MKTNIKKSSSIILLALLAAVTMDVQAQRFERGMRAGADRAPMAFLELTEAQEEQLSALKTEHYKAMKPLRAKMAEMKARERSLLSEEDVDLKAVDKVIGQQSDLMTEMKKLQVRHKLAVKDVLTDEQAMKLEQRRKHSARRGQKRSRV